MKSSHFLSEFNKSFYQTVNFMRINSWGKLLQGTKRSFIED